MGGFDFFCKVDNFLFDINEPSDIFAHFGNLQSINADNLGTDGLDFDVGFIGDFVDEIPNGKFGTFWEDIEDVPAFDVAWGLNGPHYAQLILSWSELLVLVLLPWLLEQQYSIVVHQVFQELLFLVLEEVSALIFQVAHLLYFLVVVNYAEVSLCPVDDHDNSLLDILEGLKGLQ